MIWGKGVVVVGVVVHLKVPHTQSVALSRYSCITLEALETHAHTQGQTVAKLMRLYTCVYAGVIYGGPFILPVRSSRFFTEPIGCTFLRLKERKVSCREGK